MSKKAEKQYIDFHGYDPDLAQEVAFEPISHLVHLARATAIEYESDKENGGGDGKLSRYRHEFGKNVQLFVDQTSKRLLIMGGRMYVNHRGIVN